MFTLPALPYSFDALEPFIDAKTMEIHHDKHHQAYVNNLNKALENYPDLLAKSPEELLMDVSSLPADIKQVIINNGGGHLNHSFFWETLTKDGHKTPVNELQDAINEVFGGFDGFKTKFSEVATKRFGSGWTWLVLNKEKNLEIYSTANQDSPIMEGNKPILGLDVWEHAYYLKYQNRRPEYIEAFWNIINWEIVNKKFISK